MPLYMERTVKKPRKQYTCQCCLEPIKGEHSYAAGHDGDGFWSVRAHKRCFKRAKKMCGSCYEQGSCTYNLSDCYKERVIENE